MDNSRDQSYFLFSTTNEQLEFLRFPLGTLGSKRNSDAREKFNLMCPINQIAKRLVSNNGNYASVYEKLRPEAMDPGEIVDHEGNLWEHTRAQLITP